MVDVKKTLDENGFQKFLVTTDKTKTDYIIQKANNGYSSYLIKTTVGQVPQVLQGSYTLPDFALKALTKYLETSRKTAAVRRDEYQEERKKHNGSRTNSNKKDRVQQRTTD